MSDAVSFRPMTAADIETVLKIEYAAFSHPWTRGIFTDALTAYECWVMFEGEQQVGPAADQEVEPSPLVAGESAEQNAEQHRPDRDAHRSDQGRRGACDRHGEHVAAELVGAE